MRLIMSLLLLCSFSIYSMKSDDKDTTTTSSVDSAIDYTVSSYTGSDYSYEPGSMDYSSFTDSVDNAIDTAVDNYTDDNDNK